MEFDEQSDQLFFQQNPENNIGQRNKSIGEQYYQRKMVEQKERSFDWEQHKAKTYQLNNGFIYRHNSSKRNYFCQNQLENQLSEQFMQFYLKKILIKEISNQEFLHIAIFPIFQSDLGPKKYRFQHNSIKAQKMQKQSLFSHLASQSKMSGTKVLVNDIYVIQTVMQTYSDCRVYRGIDTSTHTFVIIYAKPVIQDLTQYSSESSNILSAMKEELKNKLSPRVRWTGVQKISKFLYEIEVHQKFGPSLHEIFSIYKQKISDATFYLLGYHLIKLIEKASQLGFVCHNLSPISVILHRQPEKNELFLLNVLFAKKKNQECSASNERYCSIGAHLGLSTFFPESLEASYKDDLESVCYMLIDLYTKGRFFDEAKAGQFLDFKNNLKISDLPQLPTSFVDLFIYVRNLNHCDEINYNQWKGAFKKRISKGILGKPYEWINGSKLRRESPSNSTVAAEDNGTVWTDDGGHVEKPNRDVDFVDDMVFDDKEINSDDQTIGNKILRCSNSSWETIKRDAKIQD